MTSMAKYQTAPLARTGMPAGIPYIVANEAAERFSYYGMRAILVVFMTQHLASSSGVLPKRSVMSLRRRSGGGAMGFGGFFWRGLLACVLGDARLSG